RGKALPAQGPQEWAAADFATATDLDPARAPPHKAGRRAARRRPRMTSRPPIDPPTPESAEEQARILAQALPFLRRYAGATVVVKYGGHAMGDENLAEMFGADIALLKQ